MQTIKLLLLGVFIISVTACSESNSVHGHPHDVPTYQHDSIDK